MKRIFYTAIAAGMLFISSCSQEEGMDATHGENQMVTFEVEIPNVQSRTVDGITMGAGMQADNLIYAVYETGSTETKPLIADIIENGRDANGKFTVTIPMARNVRYDLLFMAYTDGNCAFDISKGKETNLKMLEFKSEQTPNDDAFDAFVGSLKAQGVEDDNYVSLKRPFAQVNAATTIDDLNSVKSLQTAITQSGMVIKGVPQYYDILEETAWGTVDVTYTASDIMKSDDTGAPYGREIITVDGTDYCWLTMGYVLAGEVSDTSVHNAVFQFIREEDGEVIKSLEVPYLPIQRNFSTHVVGTLLTKSQEYTILIADDLGDSNHEVDREGNITSNP